MVASAVLEGVLVADFSRVLAGPLATMTLADLGADVVKVERPGTGDETATSAASPSICPHRTVRRRPGTWPCAQTYSWRTSLAARLAQGVHPLARPRHPDPAVHVHRCQDTGQKYAMEEVSLRVAHFSDTYLPRRDGIVTSLHTLTEALSAAGHDCLTVVPRHGDQTDRPGLLRLAAIPCGVADLRLLPWPATRHVRRIAAWRPDLVHVHTPGPAGLLGVLTARRLGLPVVHTYHTDLHAYGDAYRIPAPALRIGVGLYARRLGEATPAFTADREPRHAALDAVNVLLLSDADAVVLPTPAVLSRGSLPVPTSRLYLVPAGVAPRRVTAADVAAFRRRTRLAAADRVVLFVGRVNREKGIDLLLPAFARVAAAHPRARLVLVGAVYERRWLDRLIAGSGAADRVVLTGQLTAPEVAAAYAASEVFAFPSRTDTQGLVLQEAALAGLPSVLADGNLYRTGALGGACVLAPADPEGYGAAVGRLLDDPGAAAALGAEARGRAAQHTPERYGAAMLDVYGVVTRRSGASSRWQSTNTS